MLAYTDGSGGIHTSKRRIRRCAWSVIFAQEHATGLRITSTIRGPLEGAVQTVPRSELAAAAEAVQECPPHLPLRLITDCNMIAKQAPALSTSRRTSTSNINLDLWRKVEQFLDRQATTTFIKVASHKSYLDFVQRAEGRHFLGNSLADLAAGWAAADAQLPSDEVAAYFALQKRATQVLERHVRIMMHIQDTTQHKKHKRATQRKQRRIKLQQLLDSSQHRLAIIGTRWACLKCGRATGRRCLTQLLQEPCSRQLPAQSRPAPVVGPVTIGGVVPHSSHIIHYHRGLFWCNTCGSIARTRPLQLKNPCMPPTDYGLKILQRIKGGLSPRSDVPWPLPPDHQAEPASAPVVQNNCIQPIARRRRRKGKE